MEAWKARLPDNGTAWNRTGDLSITNLAPTPPNQVIISRQETNLINVQKSLLLSQSLPAVVAMYQHYSVRAELEVTRCKLELSGDSSSTRVILYDYVHSPRAGRTSQPCTVHVLHGTRRAYLGGPCACPLPLGCEKIVLIFNAKNIMLEFEHF